MTSQVFDQKVLYVGCERIPGFTSTHNLLDLQKLCIKGTVMEIEKTLINDRLIVSKASQKFHISTIYNFAVSYP